MSDTPRTFEEAAAVADSDEFYDRIDELVAQHEDPVPAAYWLGIQDGQAAELAHLLAICIRENRLPEPETDGFDPDEERCETARRIAELEAQLAESERRRGEAVPKLREAADDGDMHPYLEGLVREALNILADEKGGE